MPTELKGPLPVAMLTTGELRIKLLGGTPHGFARIAFMAANGTTLGDTTFSAWSKETWEQAMSLCSSIEEDLADWLEKNPPAASFQDQQNYQEDSDNDMRWSPERS